MPVTVADLQANLSHYLSMAAKQDILITEHGKVIARLTHPYQDRSAAAEALFGVLPQTMTFKESMEERANENAAGSFMDVIMNDSLVIPTELGNHADAYVAELRDNDRI